MQFVTVSLSLNLFKIPALTEQFQAQSQILGSLNIILRYVS